ncbi:hypothetical protein [Aureimonas sp. SK2]|uniref:hypothetical protein n=1 Tax=Aureimonas sp. SK2 TaxID=3015992 RepID=UPI002443AC77|nr:hypothetical protein [Aureimonas sp. SK2]
MPKTPHRFDATRIALFCHTRLAAHLAPDDLVRLRAYLELCLAKGQFPPYRGHAVDAVLLSEQTGIETRALRTARPHLQPLCDALCRALADQPLRQPAPARPRLRRTPRPAQTDTTDIGAAPRKPGPKPRPIVAHPEPLWSEWTDPADLASALRLHLVRHGESVAMLARAITAAGTRLERLTLDNWIKGKASPRSVVSLQALDCIEDRYKLPEGSLRAKLPHPARAARGHALAGLPASERRRLAWHLPDDFARRTAAEQDEILAWVRTTIISGSTDYRRYQAAAQRQRFAVRFKALNGTGRWTGTRKTRAPAREDAPRPAIDFDDGEAIVSMVVDAPERLQREMTELLRFKTATLTAFGLRRSGVWNAETASQKIEHFGLMFGALVASPDGEIRGHGAELGSLSFAHLVFPRVWDWYLSWREARRGFYTKWEVDMLALGLSLTQKETGWLRQTPRLGQHLVPIPGLVDEADIASARTDWNAACDTLHAHGRHRTRELKRVARIHRDPFEPILPILEAKSPVGEYRRITEEIARRMPDERTYPKATAEAARAFLLLRFGLHTGLRQKNLRELLVCPRGRIPTAERVLEERRRGELRWSTREGGWEVLIPALAFKNHTSSFFGSKPFRLILPDLGGLYDAIEAWIDRHRARLLGPAEDPGTFFIKSVKRSSANAAYNQTTFFEAWRLAIQRYGIHNPYTGRGVIVGLLPHGPHNIRDVLATHILKQTGSYEQASYAIQDTPEMVAQHYGRFLPQDKAEIAARVLNQVWQAA